MKVPLNWLREYIDIKADSQEISRVFTSLGYMLDGKPQEIEGDTVLDLEVRQNRADCLSLIGLARELAAFFEKKIVIPRWDKNLLKVDCREFLTIQDSDLCYRFNTVTLTGLTIKESPEWMQKKLRAYGIEPINNIVDATNYVMVEMGQPLHAFDKDMIGELTIGKAHKNEKFTTLSGKKLIVTEDDIVIRDDTGILALAGIIGGDKSKVTEKTKTILLEAATYNQAFIRRSSRRHDMRTEASTRLEKLMHPELTEGAIARCSSLILQVAGGKIIDHTDSYPAKRFFGKRVIQLDHRNLIAMMGVDLAPTKIRTHLKAFSFETNEISQYIDAVLVPYFRTDVTLEADVIEEVIRLYGYDTIPARLPSTPPPDAIDSPIFLLEEAIRDILTACGYDEQITQSLTHYDNPSSEVVILQNALTSEKDMLRVTLDDDLLYGMKNRRKYKEEEIRLFEIGKIYKKNGKNFTEQPMLGIVLSGKNVNYQQIKGVCELVFERNSRKYDEKVISIRGESPTTFIAEIDLEKMLALPIKNMTQVLTTPPQLLLRDISAIVPAETRVGDLLEDLKKADSLVYSVDLGESPRETGEKKSIFIKLAFNAKSKTLTEKDADPVVQKLLKIIETQYKGEIRK